MQPAFWARCIRRIVWHSRTGTERSQSTCAVRSSCAERSELACAGVISLTATLAAEWGPFGVRVNCVSPGFTHTPALARGLETGALDQDNLKGATALRRLVNPREVAAAIVWLLSDEASGVTGANLPVDAGFLVGVPWQAYGGLRAVSPDRSVYTEALRKVWTVMSKERAWRERNIPI